MLSKKTWKIGDPPTRTGEAERDIEALFEYAGKLKTDVLDIIKGLNEKGVLSISQARIEQSTIDSSTIGVTTPAAGKFTSLETTLPAGIGTTPFANDITNGSLDLLGGAGMFGFGNNNYITQNLYYQSGWKYKAGAAASVVQLSGGDFIFYSAAVGVANAAATINERLRCTLAGQLQIPIATGTAPITVASTTKVVNLNADRLDDLDSSNAATASTIAARDSVGDLYANVFQANTGSASNPSYSFGVDGNTGMYRSAGEELAFATQGTARAWINNNGVGAGLAPTSRDNCSLQTVNGLGFPSTQVASSDANVLDDYEEGTWTPSLGGTATYNAQGGSYTKIGRRVMIDGQIFVAAIGTGSTTVISGLPFTASSARNYAAVPAIIGGAGMATNIVSIYGYVTGGTTTITLTSFVAAAAAPAGNALFQNNAYLDFSASYDI